MQRSSVIFSGLCIMLLAVTASGNQWLVSNAGANYALKAQPGIITCEPGMAYYPFDTNNGEEPQPVLTDWYVGPVRMGLPTGLQYITYTTGNQQAGDDEGIMAEYITLGIAFRNTDPVQKVVTELATHGIYVSTKDVAFTTNTDGLPIASYGNYIGACQWGNSTTITVTLTSYSKPGRLMGVLNSIK